MSRITKHDMEEFGGSSLNGREELGGSKTALLRRQLAAHFGANFFPAVPGQMIDPAVEAIACYNSGDQAAEVPLPSGVTFRERKAAPVMIMIEYFHLEDWVDDQEEL